MRKFACWLVVLIGVPVARAFSATPCSPNVAIISESLAGPRVAVARKAQGSTGPERRGVASGSALSGSAVAAALLVGSLGLRRRAAAGRRQSVRCNALSSSGSGFMGSPTATSFISAGSVALAPPAEASEGYEARQGVAGMGMKKQVWWITSSGIDDRKIHKVFDNRRRESRRRGEELFRHDTENFEFTLNNLIHAPGSRKKKIRRGRGQYGHHGRTCGYGVGGAKKRGRGTVNVGYEGGDKPLHIKTPKLSQEQMDSMKRDPYKMITLSTLNMCEDGEEVDYQDILVRGLPLERYFKCDHWKVTGKDEDDFTVRNLTVYAHAFDPPAREKIEKLGGRCVRLHLVSGIPVEDMVAALPS